MKYHRSRFTQANYQMWEAGQSLPPPQNANIFLIKYSDGLSKKIYIANVEAKDLNEALERVCFQVSLGSPMRPEDIEVHSAYNNKGKLLWADEIYYDLVNCESDSRGIHRRDFLTVFGITSAAVLFGIRPRLAKAATTSVSFSGSATAFKSVDDLFRTQLYVGNSGSQFINNGIKIGTGITEDPYWAHNFLLLHGDGANGSQSFIDSTYRSTVTAVGNTKNSTAQSKFGSGSIAFDGSGDYLTFTSVTLEGDFTIEAFIKISDLSATEVIFSSQIDSNVQIPRIQTNGGIYTHINGTTLWDGSTSSILTPANGWVHYAFTRSGSTCRTFLNGNQQDGSVTFTGSFSIGVIGGFFLSGTLYSTPYHFNGYLDEVRITKGVARYTSNFTPPAAAFLDTITGTTVSGPGGLVWLKIRSGASTGHHFLFDTTRGPSNTLKTGSNEAQASQGTSGVTAFSYNGFLLNNSQHEWNNSAGSYVSWTFQKSSGFFDIATYTGNELQFNVPHQLGITPGMIIIKSKSNASDWLVWHRGLTQVAEYNSQFRVLLNSTAAETNAGSTISYVNDTSFTVTPWSVAQGGLVNANNYQYIAYLFAHDPSANGFIRCDSFTTDASGNATINLGWEPQFVIFKRKDSATSGDWVILDSLRGFVGVGSGSLTARLKINTQDAENANTNDAQVHATGFTVSHAASASYIYLAIRRPTKPPSNGTQVYLPATRSTSESETYSSVGFSPDLVMMRRQNGSGYSWMLFDKLRGSLKSISTDSNAAEVAASYGVSAFTNSGVTITNTGTNYATAGLRTEHYFCRARGFFDIVCYAGTGVARTVPHSLGVIPELIIVKARTKATSWWVYAAPLGFSSLTLHTENATFSGATIWNSTLPTSSEFSQGVGVDLVNESGHNYVAYLFATLPGVSKIGLYNGNGTSQTINCGFSNGARFIMIKRTDSTGGWYIWDTARGIGSANDSHVCLNTANVEVTGDDSVDPENSGFIVNQNASTNINVTGGHYIYLAIS